MYDFATGINQSSALMFIRILLVDHVLDQIQEIL